MKRLLLGSLLFLALPLGATPDPQLGKNLSTPCAACHGGDGNSPVGMYPKIAGQPYAYLVQQLQHYKKGNKGPRKGANATIMYGMVAQLSEQDIENLAAYFSGQEQTPGSAEEDLVALGEKIYKGGDLASGLPACAACHGPHGLGNALAKYPRLSGQHPEYIEAQLHAFIRGDRDAPMMRGIARKMTDEQIKAVSSYASGLH